MAKIAVASEPVFATRDPEQPQAGRPSWHVLARGDGWSVSDVICTAGPRDRPFEEQHSTASVAIVVEGSFQYRSSPGRELMNSGSLFLGNPGQYFECGHEHGVGDRCIDFSFRPEYFEGLTAEAGVRGRNARFSTLRVPPVRELSSLIARACALLAASWHPLWSAGACSRFLSTEAHIPSRAQLLPASRCESRFPQPMVPGADSSAWEEIAIELAGRALALSSGGGPNRASSPAAEARVTRIARSIDSRPDAPTGLHILAREAKLSRYHFLRVFRRLTGLTPHQYIRRTRLRRAAAQLLLDPARILDIALDSGFGDVSNFNHAFRSEFGVSPRSWRKLF